MIAAGSYVVFQHQSGRYPRFARDRSAQSRSASELGFPFPRPSAARQRPRRGGLDSRYTPLPGKRTRAANRLFPQACVILGSFPRSKNTPISGQNTVKGHPPLSLIRSKDTPIQIVGQIVKEQVVGAATTVDNSTGNQNQKQNPNHPLKVKNLKTKPRIASAEGQVRVAPPRGAAPNQGQ